MVGLDDAFLAIPTEVKSIYRSKNTPILMSENTLLTHLPRRKLKSSMDDDDV